MTDEHSQANWELKLSRIITIGGFILAIIVFIFGGGFIYNDVYKSKVLSYTILPGYDMGDQFFTGIVIENRGRVMLTNVEVILSDLESEIIKLSMPGPHQSVDIVEGGEGTRELHTIMPRFSQSAQLPIYMITKEPITLALGETLLITSTEVVGKTSEEIGSTLNLLVTIVSISAIILSTILLILSLRRERMMRHDVYSTEIMVIDRIRKSSQEIKSLQEEKSRLINELNELKLRERENKEK